MNLGLLELARVAFCLAASRLAIPALRRLTSWHVGTVCRRWWRDSARGGRADGGRRLIGCAPLERWERGEVAVALRCVSADAEGCALGRSVLRGARRWAG